MKGFLLGVAAGYVLGARAGRERYEQLVQTYRKVVNNPKVRQAADTARNKVTNITHQRGAGHRRTTPEPVIPEPSRAPATDQPTEVDRP